MREREFKALKRNTDGDIVQLPEVFYRFNNYQVTQLTCDDWSRYWEYQEEVDILYNDFLLNEMG